MRRYLLGIVGAVLLCGQPAVAAQAAKPARIGLLVVAERAKHIGAFREGLRELGYVEGRNLMIEFRSAQGETRRLPRLAAELVALKVDLIVTHTTPGVRAARKATSTIPIVMANVGNAVRSGHVKSIARPGGNVTGNSFFGSEIAVKRVELLKDVLPSLSRLAILAHPQYPKHARQRAVAAARSLGLAVELQYAGGAEDLDRAFAGMRRGRADALLVLGSPIFFANHRAVVEQAARRRLPAVYPWQEAVEVGGLMSYAPDFNALYKRAAVFVDKILRGADPATLPVEQASKFALTVNLRTAKALDLAIPRSVLLRADEVIE